MTVKELKKYLEYELIDPNAEIVWFDQDKNQYIETVDVMAKEVRGKNVVALSDEIFLEDEQ